MEHRIGTTKRLISNLGANFDEENVQQVNKTVEIKEQLFFETRKSHGVTIRSGRHNPRSDKPDYDILVKHLEETKAHLEIPGRLFGDYKLPKCLMNDKRFDQAAF